MVDTFWREVRFALRGLLKDKSFAVTALLSIGLAVGANAAIFSLVNQAAIHDVISGQGSMNEASSTAAIFCRVRGNQFVRR